jgi:hypothetical protein
MLFNLSQQRHFKNTGNRGYFNSIGYGPYFEELRIWQCPLNGNRSCLSDANGPHYQITVEGGKNMLTN